MDVRGVKSSLEFLNAPNSFCGNLTIRGQFGYPSLPKESRQTIKALRARQIDFFGEFPERVNQGLVWSDREDYLGQIRHVDLVAEFVLRCKRADLLREIGYGLHDSTLLESLSRLGFDA